MSVQTMESMVAWVERNAAEAPRLQSLSAYVGYSPFYCSAQFRAYTGLTFKQYLARCRLRAAARLLRDTNKKIIEIALCCGYASPEALARAFADAYRCTPTGYRRSAALEPKEGGAREWSEIPLVGAAAD